MNGEWNMTSSLARTALAGAAALGALLALAAPAEAQRWRDCRDRIHDAHHQLELAIANHGNFSRQASIEQHNYNDVRMWCWRTYKGWWDDRYGRWRTDRWND
jgi:hypothetical protein